MTSCLTDTVSYCRSSTHLFFTNPKNRFARFMGNHKGQDKVLKFAEQGLIPLTYEIAAASGASEKTMNNLQTGANVIKLARDVTGLFNIFRGIIPGLYKSGEEGLQLLKDIHEGEEATVLRVPKTERRSNLEFVEIGEERFTGVDLLSFKENPAHHDVAYGKTEQLLKLGADACSMLGGLAYIGGFGVARPAANARKYLDLEFGPAGNQLADTFPIFMCTLHCTSIVKNSLELAFEFKAYNREEEYGDYAPNEKSHWDRVVETVLGLIEAFLELITDILNFLKVATPTYVRIPLSFSIATIGLYNVWRKTE